MRKYTSLILALAMILSMLAGLTLTAAAAEPGDMPAEDYWSYGALQRAVGDGLLTGYEDGTIRPGASITRAEAAAILNRAFGSTEKAVIAFSDVSADDWYYADVQKAVQMKTFNGMGDNAFEGGAFITREQAFTVLARAIKLPDGTAADLAAFSDAGLVSSWAVGSLAAMAKAGYVSGSDGTLNPGANITREEFAQVMTNVVGSYITAAGTYSSVPAAGNVLIRTADVTLEGVAIKGDLIIGDGVGSGDVTLHNVTLDGRLVVRGGGVNSVKLTGAGSYREIVIAKVNGNVRIYADGVEVQAVSIPDGSNDIILDGAFASVSVAAEGVTLVVGSGSTIGAIEIVSDNVAVAVSGTVSAITTAAANTEVSGSGTVASLTAAATASGTAVSTGGTQVTNNSSAPVTVGAETVIPGSSATTNSGGTGVKTDTGTGGDPGGVGGSPTVLYNSITGVSYTDGNVYVTAARGTSTKSFQAVLVVENGSNYIALLDNGYMLYQFNAEGPFEENDTLYISIDGKSGRIEKPSDSRGTLVEGLYDTAYSQRSDILDNLKTVNFAAGEANSIVYTINAAADTNFAAADGFVFLAPGEIAPSNSTAGVVLKNMLAETLALNLNAGTSETIKEIYTNDGSISGPMNEAMIEYIADTYLAPFIKAIRDGQSVNVDGDSVQIPALLIYAENTVLQYGDNQIKPAGDILFSLGYDAESKAATIAFIPSDIG